MSGLTDEPCVGAAGGITPVTNPTWVTGIARCEGRALLSQKVGLSRAANPALCACASSASLFLHRDLGECRKGCYFNGDIFVGFSVAVQPHGGRDVRQSIS